MRRILAALLCLLCAAGFLGLGVWQVERRAWKIALIARIDTRVHAPPRDLPLRWSGDLSYTRVRVTGIFRHDREALVQAVTDFGPGWWVVTPMAIGGRTILVNRGFVPADNRDPSTRRAGQARGRVAIVGLLRASEPGGGFLHTNDPAGDRWYSRDVAAIARARGMENVAPYFIDADATPNVGGAPIGGLTVIALRNNHLVYAVTWFVLALGSIVGATLFWRRGLR